MLPDLILISDILMQFNTAYVNKRSILVSNRAKIAKKYLAGRFVFPDFISALPMDSLLRPNGVSWADSTWLRLPKVLWARGTPPSIQIFHPHGV